MGTLASALSPIAADLTDAPRVYVDANMPLGVVTFMRQTLGWDVLFVLEDPSLRRAPDHDHFVHALDYNRTLITLDFDFLDDRRFPLASSPGVIVLSAPDARGLERLLHRVDRNFLRDGAAAAVPLPLRGRKVTLTP
jgi:predicted nuclease of predicted toxin-antitoxin system